MQPGCLEQPSIATNVRRGRNGAISFAEAWCNSMTALDDRATIETANTEMRDFARVLKAALIMIVRYLERRYGV